MTQNPKVTIRKADGSIWHSQSGENTYAQALLACLASDGLTDAARTLIHRLCTERIPGVSIEQDGDFYRVRSIRSWCRVTIPLRYPKRQIISTGFNRLSAGLAADPHASSSETPASPTFEVPLTQAFPRDNYVRARAALIERGVDSPDSRTVEAVAAYIAAHGSMPEELASLKPTTPNSDRGSPAI
jgi:hypothetical protein